MKKQALVFVLLLSGCQGSEEANSLSDPSTYDVTGIITETYSDKVLLELSQGLEENEKEMWLVVSEHTSISDFQKNKLEKQDLRIQEKAKANLEDSCIDTEPRTCYAKELFVDKEG
ncbi:hypothetical protein [Planococcus ruber]|uniref:hypothetical protein n=1 Tax=Planococcus ruber TaxID=2027871 RepID=UPI001FF029DF|nr:hypothetical protein [Planococcus ruber]MCJ1908981.1 hypothetical protein [Planococcus ruber]